MLRQAILALALCLNVSQASAHSEGHGTITPDVALEIAIDAAGFFAANQVDRDWSPLPQSWSGLPKSAARILAEVDGDYVIEIDNAEEGRKFYLLVAGNGGIVDANFSGTFPYVWDLQSDGVRQSK